VIQSLRGRVIVSAAAVAIAASVVSFPLTIVYFERRLDGLDPKTRREVDRVFEQNVPPDFDGIGELAIGVLITTTLGTLVGALVTRRATRLLKSVGEAASTIAAGDLSARTRIPAVGRRRDDVSRLAADFDAMADGLERLERESAESSARIAHELRNPIAVLRARLTAVQDGVLPATNDEILRLLRQTDALNRAVEDLRAVSLFRTGRLSLRTVPTDLSALLTEVAAVHGVPFIGPSGVTVSVDPNRLTQAVNNLLRNAQTHASGASAQVTLYADDTQVRIEVQDDGVAAPDADVLVEGHIPTPGWFGLGLSVVSAIAVAHSGAFEIVSATDAGFRASLRLPR
jgi:signal transduction histidine kinase